MKLTNVLTIGLFVIISLASCTFPKGDCLNGDANLLYTIYFVNFTQQETDTMYLMCYSANSDFTRLLDSSVIYGFKFDSTRAFANTRLIYTNLNYKINIKNTGQIFKLSDFTIRRAICTSGMFNKSYFNQLSGYTLNGEKISKTEIEIIK